MGKINNSTMRENNICLVLNTIRKAGSISRAELAKQLNLTSPAVTNIVSNLLSHGMVMENGLSSSSHGRKPIALSVNPDACRVLGMVISTDGVSVSIADFSGKILHTTFHRLDLMGNSEQILSDVLGCAQSCIAESGVTPDRILSMGIAAPGPLDVQNGIMLDPPNFPLFHNVPICRILENELHIPTVLDKESNAAGLAEYYFSRTDDAETVFSVFLLSHCIGGSLLLGGEIFHGFADGVGDIGHIMVDSNGPRCNCGRYGCLEALATGDAVVNQIKSRLKRADIQTLPDGQNVDRLTLQEVIRLSRAGHLLFRQALDQAVDLLSVALGNVISLISPDRILVGGPVMQLYPELVEQLSDRIHKRTYPQFCRQIRVEASSLGNQCFDEGAVMLALTAHQIFLIQDSL